MLERGDAQRSRIAAALRARNEGGGAPRPKRLIPLAPSRAPQLPKIRFISFSSAPQGDESPPEPKEAPTPGVIFNVIMDQVGQWLGDGGGGDGE